MFATTFFACTYAACNGYIVDTASSESDCYQNMIKPSESFANVWSVSESYVPLQKWLDEHKISETANELTDYDFTCEFVPDSEIP